ncbi:MAG TPA: UvrD-helicase domain-containing protein [Pirellulales bacterium]|nr:UvrD-helicase domain-containing protein [Pirellulales bacterium]
MAHGLNPAQREAVNTLRGPLLVLAGAGTGKTRVVTYRIAELIRRGTPANRILAVTFTNKAAKEMQQRSAELLGKRPPTKPEISTFHSLCVRILRRHATRLGYPEKFAIYDRGDQEGVARQALREIQVAEAMLRPGDLLYQISRWKSLGVRPDQAGGTAGSDREHLAAAAYRRYQNALKAAGAVDFDDLLLCTEDLFARFADVRATEAGRFQHLLVDEYQDTNGSQYRIVRHLAGEHRNLCVVGDDDQSIYGWRGAEVTHILRFKNDWPEAKIVRLEDNYRSTDAILTLANRLIEFNSQRHAKTLRAARPGGERPKIVQSPDETAEAREVVEDIRRRVGIDGSEPRDFAILFRTNEQPRPFELELRRLKLPYVLVGGMSFYDRKEVRDILAYLKVLANPDDEVSLLRIINVPARGVGQGAVEKLMARAIAAKKPVWRIVEEVRPGDGDLSPSAVAGLTALRDLIEAHRKLADKGSLLDVASRLIQRIGYQNELARLYKEAANQQARWNAVEEVINSLAAYEKRAARPTFAGFLEEVVLGDRDDEPDKDAQLARNAIALMTLHSAKGLEFPQVYLVGMEEGLLPHHRSVAADGAAIDEERRLCYVGITRAQDRLTMSLALTRMKWGKPRPTLPSRFLFEVTGEAEKARAVAQGRLGSASTGTTTSNRKGSGTPARSKGRAKKLP